jgi:site-specific DNA-methyltransferase (cytosine-N4-specific)
MTVLTTSSSRRCSGLTEATSTLSSMTVEAIPQPEAVSDARAGIGKVEVREGDAFDLIGKLPPESIDLIITSPPYWGLRTYGMDHNEEILAEWKGQGNQPIPSPSYEWYREHGGILGLEPLPEWYIDHLVELFQCAAKTLKARGSIWVNIGDTYFARWSSIRHDGRQGLGDNPRTRRRTPMGGFRQEKQLLLIPARFGIAMQDKRWILRNDLIWHKPNIPPRPEKDRLRLAHEHFFHFVKRPKEGRPAYYYDLDSVEEGVRDVVTISAKAGSDGHSATFPIDLIQPRILSSCPPGGMVLDPFCGTGRALTVAATHNRNALGFELSAEFACAARTNAGLLPAVPCETEDQSESDWNQSESDRDVFTAGQQVAVTDAFSLAGYHGPLMTAPVTSDDERIFVLSPEAFGALSDRRSVLEQVLEELLQLEVSIVPRSASCPTAEPFR